MHKLKLDIFDNNPFNDLKYVKKRLAKDVVKISPYRDIVDEEDYLEMLPGMLAQQEEFSTSVRYCRF